MLKAKDKKIHKSFNSICINNELLIVIEIYITKIIEFIVTIVQDKC